MQHDDLSTLMSRSLVVGSGSTGRADPSTLYLSCMQGSTFTWGHAMMGGCLLYTYIHYLAVRPSCPPAPLIIPNSHLSPTSRQGPILETINKIDVP